MHSRAWSPPSLKSRTRVLHPWAMMGGRKIFEKDAETEVALGTAPRRERGNLLASWPPGGQTPQQPFREDRTERGAGVVDGTHRGCP